MHVERRPLESLGRRQPPASHKREALENPHFADTSISDLKPPELGETEVLFLNPPRLRYLVTALAYLPKVYARTSGCGPSFPGLRPREILTQATSGPGTKISVGSSSPCVGRKQSVCLCGHARCAGSASAPRGRQKDQVYSNSGGGGSSNVELRGRSTFIRLKIHAREMIF